MSAPSESATSPSPCACTNISLMQLFHELKQKFPGVPDHIVSSTIELYCHDKQACESHLHTEVKASLPHAYHASSSAAARQLNELKVNPPFKCRNQPIIKHKITKSTAVKSIACDEPQKAVLSSIITDENDKNQLNTDSNQNIVKNNSGKEDTSEIIGSPVTVINIDNCYAKYSTESPSETELSNENNKQLTSIPTQSNAEDSGNTNYKILKSNKISHNLNERLEKRKDKKTIKKEDLLTSQETPQEKPKRPNTLDFIKVNPETAFKQTLKEPEADPYKSISPIPSAHKNDTQTNDSTPGGSHRPDIGIKHTGYPLNVSVNVNCHMDLGHPFDPWSESYENQRAVTSVNLTVCTPTSNMTSPIRDSRDDDNGFEGHVTVTVSPSTTRAPRRPAPPPPPLAVRLEPQRPYRAAPDPPELTLDRSLIERQKERLSMLAKALAQEKGRLQQLSRETAILAGPPPSPAATQRLRSEVERLRAKCDHLAKGLELGVDEAEESPMYRTYPCSRPAAAPWRCDVCTFENHPLLDKCEQCDMPNIVVGTSFRRGHNDSGFGSFRDRDAELDIDSCA